MRYFLLATICLIGTVISAQEENDSSKEWSDYWAEQVHEFQKKGESPLKEEDRLAFKAFDLFDYDPAFRVLAVFTPIEDEKAFKMKTSGSRLPVYKKIGKLGFTVNGVEEELCVYRNLELAKMEAYRNYLFVPFTDLTNHDMTYGGGRYLDLEGPLEGEVVLDFNKAYNPYCAYADGYSCPIPPIENHLEVMIEAGVLAFDRQEEH